MSIKTLHGSELLVQLYSEASERFREGLQLFMKGYNILQKEIAHRENLKEVVDIKNPRPAHKVPLEASRSVATSSYIFHVNNNVKYVQ